MNPAAKKGSGNVGEKDRGGKEVKREGGENDRQSPRRKKGGIKKTLKRKKKKNKKSLNAQRRGAAKHEPPGSLSKKLPDSTKPGVKNIKPIRELVSRLE